MKILQPIKVKNVQFNNRVVMAPMVLFGLPGTKNGIIGEVLLNHYLKRADTRIGLIIFQSASVTSKKMLYDSSGGLGGIGIFSNEHIKNIQKIAEACHQNGTKFFVQLSYPSVGYHNGDTITYLTETDIEEIKDEFVKAARRCKEAGCDGIELHGANSFFLNMFASPVSNKRKDQYGGELHGRLLLVKKIVEEIKEFTEDNFIISYRMGWNDSLDTDIKTARALEAIGVEMLHISFGIPGDRSLELSDDYEFNDVIFTGSQVKEHVQIPVIAVNDIRTFHRGNNLLENNVCDFAAYGRPFLADEEFMTKSLENIYYKPCLRCNKCQWFLNGEKCTARMKAKKYS